MATDTEESRASRQAPERRVGCLDRPLRAHGPTDTHPGPRCPPPRGPRAGTLGTRHRRPAALLHLGWGVQPSAQGPHARAVPADRTTPTMPLAPRRRPPRTRVSMLRASRPTAHQAISLVPQMSVNKSRRKQFPRTLRLSPAQPPVSEPKQELDLRVAPSPDLCSHPAEPPFAYIFFSSQEQVICRGKRCGPTPQCRRGRPPRHL